VCFRYVRVSRFVCLVQNVLHGGSGKVPRGYPYKFGCIVIRKYIILHVRLHVSGVRIGYVVAGIRLLECTFYRDYPVG